MYFTLEILRLDHFSVMLTLVLDYMVTTANVEQLSLSMVLLI